jgi:hypothetical protein
MAGDMKSNSNKTVQVIDSAIDCPDLPIVVGAGYAKAVIWPGGGAQHRSMHLIKMESGSSTIALVHPSDCVYYVLAGSGSIEDITAGEAKSLGEGAMVHIDAGDAYKLLSDPGGFSVVGGPCPADPKFYAHLVEG